MKRILITGGCGFVGSSLALDLARRGYQVTAFDNLSRRGADILLKRVLAHGVSFVRGDVRRSQDLAGLGQDFALIIACCAEPSALVGSDGRDARYLLDVNLQGAINSFEWARERRVPVLFISSSRVYPYDRINAFRYEETATRFELTEACEGAGSHGISTDMPLKGRRSLYGAAKLSAEVILQEYAAQYDLPAVINRCSVIAGPWQLGRPDQGIFAYWMAAHYFRRPLNYIGFGGQGKQVRDLLHVDDFAELVARQAEGLIGDTPRFRGDVFNVGGSGYADLSLREATEICARLTGHCIDIGSVAQSRPADMIWYRTDNQRTLQAFDWQLKHSAVNVLEDIFQWLRANEADCRKIFDV